MIRRPPRSTLVPYTTLSRSIDEAAADRLHVERRAALGAELCLQQARRAGEHIVRRRGGDDAQIQILGGAAGGGERVARSMECEIARGLRSLGVVALHDAGTLADPRVARLEPARGEFRV